MQPPAKEQPLKPKVRGPLQLLLALSLLAYPILVYAGLIFFQVRHVAILIAAILFIRLVFGRKLMNSGDVKFGLILSLLAAFAAAMSRSEIWLRMYPLIMTAGFLGLFARSLRQPPSFIERIARIRNPDLPLAGQEYCRKLTKVWIGFFIFNFTVSAITAFWGTRDVWALYNGVIAYVLMGMLFAGDWIYRFQYRSSLGGRS